MANQFTEDAADKITLATRWVLQQMKSGVASGEETPYNRKTTCTVQVTSGTADGDGTYPAKFVFDDPTLSPPAFHDYSQNCRAKGLNNEGLSNGTLYEGWLSGYKNDVPLVRVIVPAGAAGGWNNVIFPDRDITAGFQTIIGNVTLSAGITYTFVCTLHITAFVAPGVPVAFLVKLINSSGVALSSYPRYMSFRHPPNPTASAISLHQCFTGLLLPASSTTYNIVVENLNTNMHIVGISPVTQSDNSYFIYKQGA